MYSYSHYRTEKGKFHVFMKSFHMFKHVQAPMSSVLDKELDYEWVKIVEDVVHPPTNVSSNEVRKTYEFSLVTVNVTVAMYTGRH